ncbi:MAG: xanthine dehydrogenase accessory protein XdhC [Butyricicoccus pullicaecorum]|nr:xanthine dehydrogenase accessory protein XdhC [Butyricicoccus pullicaecorum]
MIHFFEKLRNRLQPEQSFVLVSVVDSAGSTPRGSGAKMAVFADGSYMGTIGGGSVEYLSIRQALKVLEEKRSLTKGFLLTKNQKADIGMICGGNVEVFFQYVDGQDGSYLQMIDYMITLYEKDVDAWLVTVIGDDMVCETGVYDKQSGLRFMKAVSEKQIIPYLKNKSVCTDTTPRCFVEPLIQSGCVYVFGGGHVAQELVPVIAHVGFRVVVYEDRENFARPELFRGVHHTILGSFETLSEHITMRENDYAVIMTRGHQSDYEVMRQVLRTQAAYIGVIGSRQKIAATTKRLLEDGISEQDIARLHTPIGLPIKGETPAEIAISIAAEMILFRAERKQSLA